jgi:hypothetical protein
MTVRNPTELVAKSQVAIIAKTWRMRETIGPSFHGFRLDMIDYKADLLRMLAVLILTGWFWSALRGVHATTLRAPLIWAVAACVVVAAIDWMMSRGWAGASWQYFAATSTFCPSMALLGAKRPQDQGWQFIVASLWLVLALPLVQRWVFSPGSQLELHAAWQWFLVVLLLIQITNHLPTRYAPAMLLVGLSQAVALGSHLPWNVFDREWQHPLLISLVLLALAVIWIEVTRRSVRSSRGWDRVWRDFRDRFGCVWALRVRERINHAAQQAHVETRLNWEGFNAEIPFAQAESLETTTRMLLRRFVSPAWISERLPPAPSVKHEMPQAEAAES